MQRITRSNADNTLVQVEDPEQLLRERCRSMAEQAEQGRGIPRVSRDSDGEEYSEAEEVNTRDLYVPDLDNTPLQRAIRNGMALNEEQTIYRIRCPKLKEYIGKDTLTVFLPEGRLEVPTDPPVDFVADCAPTPFDQPRLLIEAMQSLVQTQPELTILPGDDTPLVRNRYLSRDELTERLTNYVDLCVLYAESALRHEGAQLHGDRDEILRKEMHEGTLMQRISTIMDKLLAHMQRDIKFRKANKKIQYPVPRINPRLAPPRSAQEIHIMKEGLKDEGKNIVQIAFLPEPEEGASGGPRVIIPGEDIPDAPGRRSILKDAGLKLSLEKCSFFKKHIQYLGHLLSEEGIQPLPEKLESISKMPRPKNQKEVKQFLGLIGYYRKFVPRFADISRVLNKLTRKDEEFKWTPECDKCFNMLKDYLQEAPILRYPDPEARYMLYTDASKYAYAGMLTQTVDGTDHPITYVSGLFRGSQLNWAALTKEAYAIYTCQLRN